MGDAFVKGRLKLHLRSEQALGLSSLPVRLPLGIHRAAPVARQIAAPPRAAPPAMPVRPEPPTVASRPAPSVVPAAPTAALFVAAHQKPFEGAPLSHEEKVARLAAMEAKEVRICRLCRLHEERSRTVFGEGDVDAELFFIGEGPGEVEDRTGRPFVGPAGQKLDEMIRAMGLAREKVYIANIVKCRPPGNRAPGQDETASCTPFLVRQLEIIRPRVIVTLGVPASQYMLTTTMSMGKLRGRWHTWRGIKLMPTYHPSYLLRNYTMETRKAVWSDLQQVMLELGLKGAGRDV